MRVVYQPPIVDRLREAKYAAQSTGRTIDKIFLDESEWREFRVWATRDIHTFCDPARVREYTYMGMRLEVERT